MGPTEFGTKRDDKKRHKANRAPEEPRDEELPDQGSH